MSGSYLFDNRVLDRHARIANGLEVDSELEFAEALTLLAKFPDGDVQADDELLDSFLDRKAAYARSEAGGVGYGVLLIVACLGLFGFGWAHSSSSPNGATLLAVLAVGVAVAVIATFGHLYRRAERRGAAYTARIEKRLRQDTTGAHYGDA